VIHTIPISLIVALNPHPRLSLVASAVLFMTALVESILLLYHQLTLNTAFYLNEFMVKKISLCGVAALLLSRYYSPPNARKLSSSVPFQPATPSVPVLKSVILLVSRLLLAFLFLAVGYREYLIQKQRNFMFQRRVRAAQPDGHDYFWFKVIEFSLSIFVALGLGSTSFSLLLAITLCVEALVAWQWWNVTASVGHVLHAREHFLVNTAVAGGLFMLCLLGFGNFTADRLVSLRKKTS